MTTETATATPSSSGSFALLAEFSSPDGLLYGCRQVRDAGFTRWDAYSPFPVHGFEEAMGLSRSWVSLFVLVMGLGGAAGGMLLQWWVSVEAYPLVISGKPLFSWPAFVPVMFECGVLGGALGAVLGFLLLSKLPRHHHPLFASERFERVTDDRFFIAIESDDPQFDAAATRNMLESSGATVVEEV